MENMTELTRKMFDSATSIRSAAQAAQALLEARCFRTLGDTLKSCSGCNDPKKLLVNGWMELHPSENRKSVDKKVRNWLGGRTFSVSKKDAFQLSVIMGLSLDRTDAFLKQACGEGIHWRDPEEIIWGYGILHQKSYAQICDMLDRYSALPKPDAAQEATDVYTAEVKAKLEPVLSQSEDALFDWLCREQAALGTYRNTAYRLFIQYMDLLERAGQTEKQLEEARKKSRETSYDEDAFADLLKQAGRSDAEISASLSRKHAGFDDRITSRDILETYLYRNLVPVSRRDGKKGELTFSGIQNSLRANWPDETTISKMRRRQLPVSRKVLILLFLATNGSNTEFEENDEDEVLETRDEIFQDIYTRLNLMLQSCGFSMLDPRAPFDWMVLYCICVDDLWDVDQRLTDMLTAMFPGGNENQ